MSDEQTTSDLEVRSSCTHPEAVGKRWGDPIDEELQLDLQNYLDQWAEESDHGDRAGPFQKVRLSGADVFWLAERVRNKQGFVPDLHLEGANLIGAHLEDANLAEAHLERADLTDAHLEGAHLGFTHLERADLNAAHLDRAGVGFAHLEDAALRGAQLVGASLSHAHLERTDLARACLRGARLFAAQLEAAELHEADARDADLSEAHLEGANLYDVQLGGADLTRASFDQKTYLNGVTLGGVRRQRWRRPIIAPAAKVCDVHWNGVDVTQVRWSQLLWLGDEQQAWAKVVNGYHKPRDLRLEQFGRAVRANRQVATMLRAHGLNEQADHFAYRAHLLQRHVLRRQHKFGGYVFSLLLALLAGYGYRLGRIIIAYAIIVLMFASAFLAADVLSGQASLSVPSVLDALQISLNAVHGRVFFAQFHLDTLQSWLATLESLVGIVIEGVFVAMLIQRFLSR